ncbi:uncharacterized protein L3040_001537 [Drepanopeziza brunnea f. sp. 'multigermtubi']|uniref:uncharacterized protein n=1 Tax=Drepanopeziza brunnea f. sp. 'multigermtubi' TaxID=698441 RepID=UPI002385B565|nr:hypothetical protein L3040_001537 [Drepanopeziza brunnea f. sp. 'multigermtubi']
MLSIDFDAVSGLLGTGASPQNNIAGDSFGFFACQPRIDHQNKRALNILTLQGSRHRFKHNLVHSMESIPSETQQILNSGAEIACLHGYTHEGGAQMSERAGAGSDREVCAPQHGADKPETARVASAAVPDPGSTLP